MRREFVARRAFGNKCSKLYVFKSNFLDSQLTAHDFCHTGGIKPAALLRRNDFLCLEAVKIRFEPFGESHERDFSRIGYEGEDSIVKIMVDGLENLRDEVASESLALLINIGVAASRKVDALERAFLVFKLLEYLGRRDIAFFRDNKSRARLQLTDIGTGDIEDSLYHRTLRGKNDKIIVIPVERRPDAVRIAQGKHVARPCRAANHISAVPRCRSRPHDVDHIEIIFDEMT